MGSGNIIEAVHTTNLFTVISSVVFIATLLASGGAFAYKKYLTDQVNKASSELGSATEAFAPDKIQELVDASSRLATTKHLLVNHVTVSEVFSLLQSLTVSKVRFTSFEFSIKENHMSVAMDGESQTYNALANQSDAFSQNSFIIAPLFSDVNLTTQGNIGFKFVATLNPDLVSYKKAIEALKSNP